MAINLPCGVVVPCILYQFSLTCQARSLPMILNANIGACGQTLVSNWY